MKEAVAAAGRATWDLRVLGTLPIVKADDGSIALDATMEHVEPMVDAGVTDFLLNLGVPSDPDEAEDRLAPVVSAFRQAVGRTGQE
jgi:hypothetical protein